MVLRERNVVDPVRVGLGLDAETRGGFRSPVRQGGVDDGGIGSKQLAVQVPCANDSIATTGITGVVSNKSKRRPGRSSQDSVVAVDG